VTSKPTPRRKPKGAAAEGTVRVFVYGTLKKGHVLNRGWLGEGTLVQTGILKGFTLISLGAYPALIQIPGSEGHSVEGEVWDMPVDKFEKLRAMEEGVGYETRLVHLDDATEAKAFVFATTQKNTVRWRQRLMQINDKLVAGGDVVPVTEPEFDDDIPF
jgi:gamma-glutamylcyclotransferase (GGCT)/AIG2-like uncharacterized protein YtfP